MERLLDIVKEAGLAPDKTCVMLHMTSIGRLREGLRDMAVLRPDVFAALQGTHDDKKLATLRRCPFFLSFVPNGDTGLMFAGVWAVDGIIEARPLEAFKSDTRYRALVDEWADDPAWKLRDETRSSRPLAVVSPTILARRWIGRVHIDWPMARRAHVRLLPDFDPVVRVNEASSVL